MIVVNPQIRPTTRPLRRGTLMVEMVVCTVLLSVVGLILAPAIQSVNRQRKSQRFEALTAIQLQNLVEQFRATSEGQSNPKEQIEQAELADWYQYRYPRAELSLTVDPDADAGLIRIFLEITRPEYGDHVEQTRSLIAWIGAPVADRSDSAGGPAGQDATAADANADTEEETP